MSCIYKNYIIHSISGRFAGETLDCQQIFLKINQFKPISRFSLCTVAKYAVFGLFHRVKELSKTNQTRYGVSHVYVECKTKEIFAIAFLGKKLGFHTEICELRD